MNKKHVIGYAATALLGMGIGAAGSSSGGGQPAASGPTITTTASATTAPATTAPATQVTGPDTTITVPPVTRTVQVPGPRTTVTAPRPAPAVAMAGDGTYQVGVDVQPGTYVSAKPDSGNCYWARMSGGDSLGSIIANGNTSGQVVVTIKKTDKFFESDGCSDWTRR